MTEEWRIVPSAPDYEVSNKGCVRSRAGRQVWGGPRTGFYTLGEKMLRPGIASNGYPTVALGRRNTRTLHSLVAEAFIGPCPVGMEVRHRDGIRTNPEFSNLHYGTRKDNIADAWEHGTRSGKTSNSAKAVATKDQRYPGWRTRVFGRGQFRIGGHNA